LALRSLEREPALRRVDRPLVPAVVVRAGAELAVDGARVAGRDGCCCRESWGADGCVDCRVVEGDPPLGFLGAGSGAGVGGSAVVGAAESPAEDGKGLWPIAGEAAASRTATPSVAPVIHRKRRRTAPATVSSPPELGITQSTCLRSYARPHGKSTNE
jgi:hypothetical protein